MVASPSRLIAEVGALPSHFKRGLVRWFDPPHMTGKCGLNIERS